MENIGSNFNDKTSFHPESRGEPDNSSNVKQTTTQGSGGYKLVLGQLRPK